MAEPQNAKTVFATSTNMLASQNNVINERVTRYTNKRQVLETHASAVSQLLTSHVAAAAAASATYWIVGSLPLLTVVVESESLQVFLTLWRHNS